MSESTADEACALVDSEDIPAVPVQSESYQTNLPSSPNANEFEKSNPRRKKKQVNGTEEKNFHRRQRRSYGVVPAVGDGNDREDDTDVSGQHNGHLDADEEETLLGQDGRGFEVSGHHLTSTNKKTTSTQTLVHLVKGNLGTGILAIPVAMKHSGLLTGCVLLPFLGLVCIHCMHMLVWSAVELQTRLRRKDLDYAGVGEQAFATGPLCSRRLSGTARFTINSFLFITQMGFCCVYVVFMSANIKQFLDEIFPQNKWSTQVYTAIITIPLLAIAMIKTLKSLYIPSLISNGLIFVGLCLLLKFLLPDLPDVRNRPQYTSLLELPLYFATSIYAFEGIGVVLPLHRNMKRPSDLGHYNGVLNTAMIIVTCLYFGVGFFGYLKYGDAVQGSITLSLPPDDPVAMAISLIFVVAIFLTYALMLYVPVELSWPWFMDNYPQITSKWFTIYLFRAILVGITILAALLIPHVGLFISLVGAVASSTLALIFPPMINMLTFHQTQSKLMLLKNILIMTFGVTCFLMGSYTSILAIIVDISSSTNETLIG